MFCDNSDSSSNDTASQASYEVSSSGNSPIQQVQQITSLTNLLTIKKTAICNGVSKPSLKIIEQPNEFFRFRYESENKETHGCILGQSSANNKQKTYPTVELVNYKNGAVIRCCLAQFDKNEIHPYPLTKDDCSNMDVSEEVGPEKGYKACFTGLSVINATKKNIPALLHKKMSLDLSYKGVVDDKKLYQYCKEMSKTVELNKVRLRFSAYDSKTNKEICEPIFSKPIHNLKSAQTNDLKICRMSLCSGRTEGGDELYLLVEKVNKKDIKVEFYETDDKGNIVWNADGCFKPIDVHHQYAIVVKTPAYNRPLSRSVQAWVRLRRGRDGRASEPLPFTYTASPVFKLNKKRKFASYSSIGSSDDSIKSASDIPAPAVLANLPPSPCEPLGDALMDKFIGSEQRDALNLGIEDLMSPLISTDVGFENDVILYEKASPLLSRGSAPVLPDYKLSSSEFQQIVSEDLPWQRSEEIRQFLADTNLKEYLQSSGLDDAEYLQLHADSGQAQRATTNSVKREPNETVKTEPEEETADPAPAEATEQKLLTKETENDIKKKLATVKEEFEKEYKAFYTQADGLEVKMILKRIVELLKEKDASEELRHELQRLFTIRLSNGDTFLHMVLWSDTSKAELIARLLRLAGLRRLLRCANHAGQTPLHVAVLRKMPRHAGLLVQLGCDPMDSDNGGDNAFHYAVTYNSCLRAILDAAKETKINIDLDAYNSQRKTALHLAAYRDRAECVKLLLSNGAAPCAADAGGRAPLHCAVYGDSLKAAKVLLESMPESDVDLLDNRGYSAIQILCGGPIRTNTVKLIELLLEKQANPISHAKGTRPAWIMASDKPELLEILKPHLSDVSATDDSDTEEEDEHPLLVLEGSDLYLEPLAQRLDGSGGWRALALRTRCDALASWFERTPSPTTTLIKQIKECAKEMSSSSLAQILQEIGETEAADIIMKHILKNSTNH